MSPAQNSRLAQNGKPSQGSWVLLLTHRRPCFTVASSHSPKSRTRGQVLGRSITQYTSTAKLTWYEQANRTFCTDMYCTDRVPHSHRKHKPSTSGSATSRLTAAPKLHVISRMITPPLENVASCFQLSELPSSSTSTISPRQPSQHLDEVLDTLIAIGGPGHACCWISLHPTDPLAYSYLTFHYGQRHPFRGSGAGIRMAGEHITPVLTSCTPNMDELLAGHRLLSET